MGRDGGLCKAAFEREAAGELGGVGAMRRKL